MEQLLNTTLTQKKFKTNRNGTNVDNVRWKATWRKLMTKEIPVHHNNDWACSGPFYMEDWTQRAK